jgi:PAS domain S-box-containing protein
MLSPLLPENELERVAALKKLNLLDTDAEERFDKLTRLARQLFKVKIALVSLVDSDRQWFKSKQGLDACETGRDISFCGHAILGEEIFEVPDAAQDDRFSDNPLVTGPPDIRFYAGMPLTTLDGYSIGTLCIIDPSPRKLNAEEERALKDIASLIESEINHLQLQEQRKTLEQSQLLGEVISRVQSGFIREESRQKAFDRLLEDTLRLTESEYGFIGEVLKKQNGEPYLKTYAITNIAWDEKSRSFYEEFAPKGMEFTNLNTLFGHVMTSGEVVISNDPVSDPRAGGLPQGHPAMNAFLGIPVYHSHQLVAIIGVANREPGYDQYLVDFLKPLLATVGQLIVASRLNIERELAQQEVVRLSRVASQTTNAVIVTDTEGKIEWVNDGFIRLTGYEHNEVKGRRPGDFLQGPETDPEVIAYIVQSLVRKESFSVDVLNYSKSGEAYWVRINCNPIYSANGVHEGFIAIEVDITGEKKDAEKIRNNERRLGAIIEGTNIGTWEWYVQTGETTFNERWAEIVGYSLSELEPVNIETWMNLAHPEDLENSAALLEQHFSGQSDYYDCKARMRHKEGHWVWVHDRGRVLEWDQDKKPVFMSGTHADISEQMQAEYALRENEARLRSLFELSPIGIALNVLETGQFIDLNQALLAPTGYSREEFENLSFWDITPIEYAPIETEQLEKLATTGRYGPYEKEYIRKDGSRYPVLLNGMLVEEPNGRKLIWSIIEDISERKRIERMKNEFISTVSHELRTPLTAISGALGLINGGVAGELPEGMSKMLDVAFKNSQRLILLINDLLDMEKLLAGKMSFDLRINNVLSLLEHAVETNQSYADQFQVQLRIVHCDPSLTIKVDAARFAQIMSNLLSNGAKFSPTDAHVDINAIREGNRVRISVRDFGQGIPEAFHSQIFQKFSQADSSDSRQKGGTGLGLAITRELIERMQGEIDFTSWSTGTEFFIYLPIVQA